MDKAAIVKNAKLVVGGIIALLALIIIIQNVEPVETRILFVAIRMPRALLLFLTLVLGACIGFLGGSVYVRRRLAQPKAQAKPQEKAN